jgi:DNA-binding GntR family transcriptional regulator
MTDHIAAVRRVEGRQRPPLPEEVASYARELIISGSVRPGEFLRLEPIAIAVGVSNTPVREGLLALRDEGFVRLVPRHGFVVAPFAQQDVQDLFLAQARLAGELAARAAKTVTAAQIESLEMNLVASNKALTNNDLSLVGDLAHAFHREVNLASDSHRLALLLGRMVRHLPKRFYATIEGEMIETHDAHALLLAALRTRDARRARSLMSEHIIDAADRIVGVLEAQGRWATEADRAAS